MEAKISVNDFVWAKLTGHPPWPSIIIEPEYDVPEKPLDEPEKEYFWVYFFGSHDYSWIEERHIKPYEEYKDKYVPLYKQSSFVGAVEELEEELQKIKSDPNYQVQRIEKFKVQHRGVKRYGRARSTNPKKRKSKSFDAGNDIVRNFNSSETIVTTNLVPSDKIFGVIGLGIIGGGLARNLINSGHTVNIWNRTSHRSDELMRELGSSRRIRSHLSPRAILSNSDIVFICVSNHINSKRLIENNFGINSNSDNILRNKSIVIMTSLDPEASSNIREMLERKGATYLEAQIQGSKLESEEERFCMLTAGDEELYHACQSCFYAMGGTSTFFLGEVGNAAKINIILQLMKGIFLVALAEGLALAERCGMPQDKFLDIFNLTGLSSPYLKAKGNTIVNTNFADNKEQSLKNLQGDIKTGLELSNNLEHEMLLSSMANQIFKHCCKLDYSNHDSAAIYLRNKH